MHNRKMPIIINFTLEKEFKTLIFYAVLFLYLDYVDKIINYGFILNDAGILFKIGVKTRYNILILLIIYVRLFQSNSKKLT